MTMLTRCKIKGFTLIEVVIVIVLVSILASISAQILNEVFTAYFRGQNLIDADSQARIGLKRVSVDLHNLRSTANITSATATALTFTDLYGNVIAYQVTSSQLQRNNLALATNIQSITFQYYDLAGALLATPVTDPNKRLIRYIKLTLVSNTFSYTTGVTLWNTL